MNFIATKDFKKLNNIKIVDEIIILELVKIAFKYNYKIKRDEIRDLLFNSKYTYTNVEKKELELNNYLSQLNNIIEKHQNNEYNCILLNNDNDYLKQRLYISPNPENMYELIKVVVNYFIKEKLTVKIKYQQSTKIKYTDRIIIFINENAQDKTEQILTDIRNNYSHLFLECERSKSWLYKTKIRDVYKTTEDIGQSNTEKLIDVIIEAKSSYDYLYKERENELLNEEKINYMKILIQSILLRKGLLLSINEDPIYINDINIKTIYDIKKEVMTSFNMDNNGYYETKFYPSNEGRASYLDNFYSINKMTTLNGVEYKHLTKQERQKEINKMLKLRMKR